MKRSGEEGVGGGSEGEEREEGVRGGGERRERK